MTNNLEQTNKTPANGRGNFTFQALDLLCEQAEAVGAKFSVEAAAKLDGEISIHWIFANTNYAPRLLDMAADCKRSGSSTRLSNRFSGF